MTKLYYSPVDPGHIRREREKSRELKGSQWWKQKVAQGICHYCGAKFLSTELTMDHILPLGRGGKSNKGNIVTSCKPCNTKKAHLTPAEIILG